MNRFLTSRSPAETLTHRYMVECWNSQLFVTVPMTRPACADRYARGRRGLLLLSVLIGPPAAAQAPRTTTAAWRVTTSDPVDVWYHGVALLGYGGAEPAMLYDPGYAAAARRTRSRLGLAETPLDRAAPSVARTFAADPAFELVHFLPLYFIDGDWAALHAALRRLAVPGGVGTGTADPATDRTLAAIAVAVPDPAQRTALWNFADLLDDEWRVYLRSEAHRTAGPRAALANALEYRWNDTFAPALAPYLTRIHRTQGTIVLSPALGREGRSVARTGRPDAGALVAVALPRSIEAASIDDAAFDVLRELCFATARTVTDSRDSAPIDPAAGERESRTIAVRCGALVLERYLPRLRAAYQARFVALQQPAAPPDTTTARFARVFPVPSDVERRLARALASP
jgi:hypothetical protein